MVKSKRERPMGMHDAEGRSTGSRGLDILLRVGARYTILQDRYCLVLRDTSHPKRPAYFADLDGALHEVFKRQVNRRLVKDQRKDLAALRDAIDETREELREVLSRDG